MDSDDAARQDDEVQVLKAIFGEEAVEEINEANVTPRKLTIRQSRNGLMIYVTMPPSYPSTSGLTLTVGSEKFKIDQCSLLRQTGEAACVVGEESVFLATQAIFEKAESLEMEESSTQAAVEQKVTVPPSVLGRRLLWSHHIISSEKRKIIKESALELKIGALCKIGWPGIIVCEGNEAQVKDFVSRLSALRWQYFCVRGEESFVLPDKRSVDDARKLPAGFLELQENEMKVLSQICKDAGLEHLFLSALH